MKAPSDGGPDASAKPDDQPIADALALHHRGLEQALDIIAVKSEGRDPLGLRRAWDTFEKELLRHIEIEEADLLPLFERSHPDDARGLRGEHDTIREKLFELGLALDLHQLRADAVTEFAARLRVHARREDGGLYPWIERYLSREAWHTLGHHVAGRDAFATSVSTRN
jgi:hemerythrin-like domain-containing protein